MKEINWLELAHQVVKTQWPAETHWLCKVTDQDGKVHGVFLSRGNGVVNMYVTKGRESMLVWALDMTPGNNHWVPVGNMSKYRDWVMGNSRQLVELTNLVQAALETQEATLPVLGNVLPAEVF
jgi:hypothetical protein